MMNEFKIIDTWEDSLIWCPSQCELRIKYKGKPYIIYLRWRSSDPWTADLIETDKKFEMKHGDSAWTELDIPFFIDEHPLDEIKNAAIKEAKKVLNKLDGANEKN